MSGSPFDAMFASIFRDMGMSGNPYAARAVYQEQDDLLLNGDGVTPAEDLYESTRPLPIEHLCSTPLSAYLDDDDEVVALDLCSNHKPCEEHPEPAKMIGAAT